MTIASLLSDLRILDGTVGPSGSTCVRILQQLGAHVCTASSLASAKWGARDAAAAEFDAVVTDESETPLPLQPDYVSPVTVSISSCRSPGWGVAWKGLRDSCALDDSVTAALTGAHAAVALLAAHRWSRSRGRSASVEIAAMEVLAACQGDALPELLCPRAWPPAPRKPWKRDRLHVLRCADGYVGLSLSAPDDRRYFGLLTGLETEQIAGSGAVGMLEPWARGRTRDEIFHEAQLWRLPVVPVLTPEEVRADAQSRARGIWNEDDKGALVLDSPFRVTTSDHGPGYAVGALQEPSRTPSSSSLPLDGVRVADLGMVWAGPYAGRLLAGLGALVIKIEGSRRPDGTRRSAGGCDGAFADLNQGKKSLVLDLLQAEGREVFLELSRVVDVVLENYSPRVMPNFGLDYPVLSETNPGLVMLSLPAFGSTGPWANYVAYGSGLELATGLATSDDGHPGVASVPYLDYLAGTCGAVAVLAALHERERTGHGCQVEVAQREVACQLMTGAYGKRIRSGEADSERPAPGARGQSPWTSDSCAERLVESPFLRASGLLAGSDASAGACHHFARLPWLIHGVDVRQETDAPAFGAHSREVLRDVAGIDDAQFEHLVDLGIVVEASSPTRAGAVERRAEDRIGKDPGAQ